MSEVIPTNKDSKHNGLIYGGIKKRAFCSAAVAVTSTATKFLAVTMIVECLKRRTQFRRRPNYALFVKIF
jgi:hypothetical protein